MPKIYDNIELQFARGLSEHISTAKRVDYCVGYFNLRGWSMVCNDIDGLAGDTVMENGKSKHRYCRLLVGMTKTPLQELLDEFSDPEDMLMDNEKATRYRKKLAIEFAEQLTYGMPTTADERTLQILLSQLKSGRVIVKLFLEYQLHAKLYLAHNDGPVTPIISLLGSSNFTIAGLSRQGELNVDVVEQDSAIKLDNWFTARWNNRWCLDITNDLIDVLESSWARPELIPPYHIYLKMAYHLSREARAGLAEYRLSREFTNELLDFQQAAVKIAAHHLHHRRGVMIGDVVGLGKTITATAVAKILEDDFGFNTLITCPKNLVDMWEQYREKYGLHAKVVSHSMLRQTLPDLRRYRLIIIDESHNFRNNLGETYRALKSYIEENDSHVVLLSATPYNKSFLDLSNQLKLFLPEDHDLGIMPERYIESLGGMIYYNQKHTETNVKTIGAFEKSDFADDWREIMKYYLVRRTRSFIKTNYAKTDKITGRKYLVFSTGEESYFPERLPKKVEFSLNSYDPADQYAKLYDSKVVDSINELNLPRYGLQLKVDEKELKKATDDELFILRNLSRAGKSVRGFCKTNLYKRLESSGYSFLLSLSRHILRNYIFIYAIRHGLKLPVSGKSVNVDIYTDEDEEEAGLNMNFTWDASRYEDKAGECYRLFERDYATRFQWIRSSLFKTKELERELEDDAKSLLSILKKVGQWIPDADRKLDALADLLNNKHKKEKALIFTQFADTAQYIYQELDKRKVDNMAIAIGGQDDIISLVKRFSPISNDNTQLAESGQIRVMVATDVLSEGQNLQDAHIVINFDLPWALVRLIQRAGRVDRLGQKSQQIICYSFLPEDGIEHVIGLRKKLKTRISQNAEVVGSDEVFFDGDPINIADLYSEKSGIFDEDEDTEVDLASYAYQIWKNAIDENPTIKKTIEDMPNVVFSAKHNTMDKSENGVIVYANTNEHNDALAWLDSNGKIISQSQYMILRAAECDKSTPTLQKLANHHDLVKSGVKHISTEAIAITGTLGRKNSVKYRTYMRMSSFLKENEGTLFVPAGLKNAMDALYQYPLRESAIEVLSRQMRSGVQDQTLAELIVTLYESDRLCNVSKNSEEQGAAQIICSMSLIGGV
jgi:superfamily II DNA or RNA helicase